jgi:hypothetical protein
VVAPLTNIPNAPVIANIDDNVGSVTGRLTNGKTTDDTTPTLNGTAKPNATVRIYDGITLVGTPRMPAATGPCHKPPPH